MSKKDDLREVVATLIAQAVYVEEDADVDDLVTQTYEEILSESNLTTARLERLRKELTKVQSTYLAQTFKVFRDATE